MKRYRYDIYENGRLVAEGLGPAEVANQFGIEFPSNYARNGYMAQGRYLVALEGRPMPQPKPNKARKWGEGAKGTATKEKPTNQEKESWEMAPHTTLRERYSTMNREGRRGRNKFTWEMFYEWVSMNEIYGDKESRNTQN